MNKIKSVLFMAGISLALVFTPVAVFAQNEQKQPQGQYQYPPPQGQYQYPPPQGQYQYPPPQGQYQYPPPQGQYQYPPPQGQYQYPPPQGQYQYPPPYPYPPQQQYSAGQEYMEQADTDQDNYVSYSRWNNQASRDKSIGVSIGYERTVIEAFKDYPFIGFGLSLGVDLFVPLTDVAKLGSGISIYYFTASAEDEYDTELTLSGISLGLFPTIRLGREKTYADISFGMSVPISSDVTLEVPGYETKTQEIKNTKTDFQLSLNLRFDVIGFDVSKVLTGSDKSIGLSAAAFISIGDAAEMVPHISYFIGDVCNQLILAIGFDSFF